MRIISIGYVFLGALLAVAGLSHDAWADELCAGEDNRILLEAGTPVDAELIELSAEQVDRLRSVLYVLRSGMPLAKKHRACVAVAISPKHVLTVGHCKRTGMGKPVAFQFHLDETDGMRFDDIPFIPLTLSEINGEKAVWKFKTSSYDLAVFERTEGEFEHFLPFEPDFRFDQIDPQDRFALVANSREKKERHLLYLHPAQSVMHELVTDQDGTWTFNGSFAIFCATFQLYNSGAPLIRFYQESGGQQMSVVAVAGYELAYFPSCGAVRQQDPSFSCPDPIPNAGGSTLRPIAELLEVATEPAE